MNLIHIFSLTAMAIASGLFIATAISDIRHYRIPNRLVLLIAASFVPWLIMQLAMLAPHEFIGLFLSHSLAAIAVFVVGIILYSGRLLGGGDVKLMAVAALFAGFAWLPRLLLLVALIGGAQALYVLWRHRWRPNPDGARPLVPYGLAIGVGAVLMLWLREFSYWQ